MAEEKVWTVFNGFQVAARSVVRRCRILLVDSVRARGLEFLVTAFRTADNIARASGVRES